MCSEQILIFFLTLLFTNELTTNAKDSDDSDRNVATKKICFPSMPGGGKKRFRAFHMSCFLRADTGPCRADIIQWYFDVRKGHCYQFFWGGCQGNGNRFESKQECDRYCKMKNDTLQPGHMPHFCSLDFDYGTCFGHYYRFYWDANYKVCKRRVYSGCGGNQNNFNTLKECRASCVTPPNNTLHSVGVHTRCFNFDDFEERR